MSDALSLTSGSANVASISESLIDQLKQAATESTFRSSGAGSFYSTWQTVTSRIDRLGYNPTPPNHEVAGLTFITRPKLNLTTTSLRQDPTMSTMASVDPLSFPFSIRCYLDSKFAQWDKISGIASLSPFVNSDVPFIVPLTNCLQSITGFPSFDIDTETSNGGWFGEDQTIAKGSDMNMRTYELNATFRDFQGGYIMAMFLYWARYIALVTKGITVAYPEDIIARRLNYTCSIYRFVLDPSRRFITKWAKATGCFPKSVPIGSAFDIPGRENYIHATQEITIPFVANTIEMMDPRIFADFNVLAAKWAGDPGTRSVSSDGTVKYSNGRVATSMDGSSNFCGIPFINTAAGGGNELMFLAQPEELEDPAATIMNQIRQSVDQQVAAMNGSVNPSLSDTVYYTTPSTSSGLTSI